MKALQRAGEVEKEPRDGPSRRAKSSRVGGAHRACAYSYGMECCSPEIVFRVHMCDGSVTLFSLCIRLNISVDPISEHFSLSWVVGIVPIGHSTHSSCSQPESDSNPC